MRGTVSGAEMFLFPYFLQLLDFQVTCEDSLVADFVFNDVVLDVQRGWHNG